jgi:hypothetical protein
MSPHKVCIIYKYDTLRKILICNSGAILLYNYNQIYIYIQKYELSVMTMHFCLYHLL